MNVWIIYVLNIEDIVYKFVRNWMRGDRRNVSMLQEVREQDISAYIQRQEDDMISVVG